MHALDHFRGLGSSGLRVSPLCLGTMTFGDKRRGCDDKESARIFNAYADGGGNFIDTAVAYGQGESERILGALMEGRRDQFVVATKYAFMPDPADVNSGGNSRRSLMRALDTSLQRLKTDYIDLMYVHAWDFRTPVEAVMRALDDAVRAGKILFTRISNTPAWKVAEGNTWARCHGLTPFAAYQAEWSLIERTTEEDVVPMCHEQAMTVLPYSPLAGGLLTNKYGPEDFDFTDGHEPTLRQMQMMSGGDMERKFTIVHTLRAVASETHATPGQVALTWLMKHPARPLPVIGATSLGQVEDNLGCLGVDLSPEQMARLNEASEGRLSYPHRLLALDIFTRTMLDAGKSIEGGYGVDYGR